MIAVIADDLTGAAELAGIGLIYGLKVELSTRVNPLSDAELLVVATDARSKTQDEAVADMVQVTKELAALNPEFIFKKVDSVLRGYIIPEMSAQLKVLKMNKAVLVPANPALGRTIENGKYLINGVPISNTAFSADPEFPAVHSDVLKLLNADSSVQLKRFGNVLGEGVTVAEIKSENDLYLWAKVDFNDILLAGASGFFRAVLENCGFKIKIQHKKAPAGNSLYVFGSAFLKSTDRVTQMFNAGFPGCYLPGAAINSEIELAGYCDKVCNLINKNGKASIAVNPLEDIAVSALELRNKIAGIVEKVFNKVEVKELIIEGGSTAAAILKKLQINTMQPLNEYATGVIRSKVIGKKKLYVTLKPGSYTWPEEVITF